MATLNSNIPSGPLASKWESYKFNTKLINPANKRKYKIIVVGAGLAGASASATLAELGYEVHNFVFHDSPRRAHSVWISRNVMRWTGLDCMACQSCACRMSGVHTRPRALSAIHAAARQSAPNLDHPPLRHLANL